MNKGLKATKVLKNGLVDESVMIITRKCFDKQIDIIETELKALEIIKEKRVDCNALIYYLEKHNETGHIDYAFDSYNDYAQDSDKPQLTKKEFNLLKEVLL